MANRERKRAERQKRKRRAAGPRPAGAAPEESFQERMARRAEEKNAEARAGLKPLPEGERPRAVTVGAVISTLIALVFTGSAVAALAGVEIDGSEPSPMPLATFAAVLWAMAVGMWRARYWAVLGFQTLLVLLLLGASAGLVSAASLTWLQVIGTVVLIAGLGTLFYFMIKAMARIQMPERPS